MSPRSVEMATIRPATADDEQGVGALHARCLDAAFAGLLGDWLPPSEERAERQRAWTGPFGAPHPRHALFVAERDGRVIGFTAVGPTRDRDDDGLTVGELRVLMVDADQRGRGVGPALIEAGEHAMRQSGLTEATLWVIPSNAGAMRCYEGCGWRADGSEQQFTMAGRELRGVRYRKRLVA